MLHLISTVCSICSVKQFRWQITWKNGIKFGMLMYPDVLSSADIDADGIVAISCVHPSVQLYVGLGLGTVVKSLWRNAAAIEAYGYYCPSVRLFTTFWGFSAFADKSLERNIIKFGMLIYPADIDADGNCCHFITHGRHRRQRVLTSVIASIRLSVPNDIATLTL